MEAALCLERVDQALHIRGIREFLVGTDSVVIGSKSQTFDAADICDMAGVRDNRVDRARIFGTERNLGQKVRAEV